MSDRLLPGIHDTPDEPKIGKLGCLVFIAAMLVLVVVFTVFANVHEEPYDPNNATEAIAQCEAAIEKRLKAPTTANFTSTATGSKTWTVKGIVDSENSFGAKVRSNYQCTVIVDSAESIRTRVDFVN